MDYVAGQVVSLLGKNVPNAATGVSRIVGIPRNDVEVKMKDSLPPACPSLNPTLNPCGTNRSEMIDFAWSMADQTAD